MATTFIIFIPLNRTQSTSNQHAEGLLGVIVHLERGGRHLGYLCGGVHLGRLGLPFGLRGDLFAQIVLGDLHFGKID